MMKGDCYYLLCKSRISQRPIKKWTIIQNINISLRVALGASVILLHENCIQEFYFRARIYVVQKKLLEGKQKLMSKFARNHSVFKSYKDTHKLFLLLFLNVCCSSVYLPSSCSKYSTAQSSRTIFIIFNIWAYFGPISRLFSIP